ncbi:hypothetical protein BDZ91DRAFT_715395 [Kalaharituber pfeilii]|nr:hypothetical protein BDZ91DRAFT_715395 [Kalaharituber pfeilii]
MSRIIEDSFIVMKFGRQPQNLKAVSSFSFLVDVVKIVCMLINFNLTCLLLPPKAQKDKKKRKTKQKEKKKEKKRKRKNT